jgi:hypothetical protein
VLKREEAGEIVHCHLVALACVLQHTGEDRVGAVAVRLAEEHQVLEEVIVDLVKETIGYAHVDVLPALVRLLLGHRRYVEVETPVSQLPLLEIETLPTSKFLRRSSGAPLGDAVGAFRW